jgi:tetratricopeptide (TPR) repeat protein
MLKHFPTAAIVLALGLPVLSAANDDGQLPAAGTGQSTADGKKPSTKSDSTPNSPEVIKKTLRTALKQIRAVAEAAAKSENEIRIPSPAMFSLGLSKELEADAVQAIGRAQAKVGSIEEARATWQNALDLAAAISSLDAAGDRASVYVKIAKSQNESGEQSEARLTLRQALQSARAMSTESRFGMELPGMDDQFDPQVKKTGLLRQIAQLQAETGEKARSDESFRLAVEAAEGIKEPLKRVRHLLEIAQSAPAETAKGLWSKALDFSLSLTGEYPRARAVESVIRARLESLPADETLAIVADRLKDKLQHYLLWVFADAIASSDKPFARQTVARLIELASKAEFSRPSKKIKTFERIAEAQARLGDYDGAYRTAGEPHPVNDVQNFRATQARVRVMKAIADAQLKAKQRDAAKDTVHAALELISPLPDEDAEAFFPLADLCLIQAKSGDIAGTLNTVGAVSSSKWKVAILSEIAAAHADAHRQEDARKTVRLATEAARGTPDDTLWEFIPSASRHFDAMGTRRLSCCNRWRMRTPESATSTAP